MARKNLNLKELLTQEIKDLRTSSNEERHEIYEKVLMKYQDKFDKFEKKIFSYMIT